MLSKNNFKEQILKNQPRKQRFAIRKLTIGVASVLVGFTFMGMMSSVSADSVTEADPNEDSALTKTAAVNTTQDNEKSVTINPTVLVDNDKNESELLASNQQVNTAAATTSTNSATETTNPNEGITPAHFTGTVSMDPATGSAHAFGTQSGMTPTTTITYTMTSWGGDWQETNVSFKGNSQFIIFIPQGFTTDGLTLMNGSQVLSGDYVQSLGNVGPNEEQAFLVTFPWIPAYTGLFKAVAKLTVNDQAVPNEYTASTDTLFRAVANGAFVTGSQLDTLDLDGTKYQVLHSVADGGSTKSNRIITYTIGDYQQKVYFTGQVTFENGNSNDYGTGTNDRNSTTITYMIQNNISGDQVDYYQGSGDYFVFIPQGFKATSLTIGSGYKYSSDVQITDLGMVGPNGQQVYKVHTTIKPSWRAPLSLNAEIVAQTGYSGKAYTIWGADLLKAVYDENNYLSSTDQTVTVGGESYKVFNATYNAAVYHYGFNAMEPQTFTGTTQWADGNNHQLTNTSKSEITYKIQGWGVSGAQDSLGQGQYLVYIPQGFTTTGLTIDKSQFFGKSNAPDVAIQELGTVNGQQVYLVTVAKKPSYNNPLYLKAALTANSDAGGSYVSSTYQLLYAVENNGSFIGQSVPLTINGTTYSVIKTAASTSGQSDATNAAQNYTYMFPNVGTTPINSSDFTVTKVSGQAVTTSDTSKDSGYELLNVNGMVFKRNVIKAGSYLNIQWGLPTANGLVPYDQTLSSSVPVMFNGEQIGTIYSMGTTYRLVFNSRAAELNQNRELSVDFSLKWNNAGSHAPSADSGKLVYRYNNDQSQNGQNFTFVPTNDLQISGTGTNLYSSGLQVKGTYIYPGYHYGEQAYVPIIASAQVSKRYWQTNTTPAAAPNWGSTFYITPNINTVGKDFTVTVDVPVFAADSGITIKPHTEDNQDAETTIANNIKKAEAPKIDLSNTVTGTNDTYQVATSIPNDVGVKVTIDHQNYTDANGKQRVKYIFHIVMDSEAALNGSLIDLLDVTSNQPFTVPDGIKSYAEDNAAANQISKGSYTGVNTGNKALLTTLENAGQSSVTITSTKLAQPIESNNLQWGGFTGLVNNTDLDISGNSGNASQRSDADMYNPQGTAMWIFSDDEKMLQKSLEGNADFRHVSLRFRNGFARSGQGVDNMYSIIKELRQQDSNAVLRVHWDLTGLFLGEKTANVTITYPDGSTDTTTMKVLVLQEPYFINYYQKRPDEKGSTTYVDPTNLMGNLDTADSSALGRPVNVQWVDGQGPAITADTSLGIYPESNAQVSVTYNDGGLSLVSWPKNGAFTFTVPTMFVTHNLQTTVSRGQKQSTMIVQDRATNQIDSATTFDLDGHQLQTYLRQADGTLRSADGEIFGQLLASKAVATTASLQDLVNLAAMNQADYTLNWSATPTRNGSHLQGLVAAQLAPAMFINIPVDVQVQDKTTQPVEEKPADISHQSPVEEHLADQPVVMDHSDGHFQLVAQLSTPEIKKKSMIEHYQDNPAMPHSVNTQAKRLPQTGEQVQTGLIGLGVTGLLAMFGLTTLDRKRNNN